MPKDSSHLFLRSQPLRVLAERSSAVHLSLSLPRTGQVLEATHRPLLWNYVTTHYVHFTVILTTRRMVHTPTMTGLCDAHLILASHSSTTLICIAQEFLEIACPPIFLTLFSSTVMFLKQLVQKLLGGGRHRRTHTEKVKHLLRFHGPTLTGSGFVSSSKFKRQPFLNGWIYVIKKYGVVVTFNGMISLLHVKKICQLVQKLLVGDTQTA
jgi:hypothetical protein